MKKELNPDDIYIAEGTTGHEFGPFSCSDTDPIVIGVKGIGEAPIPEAAFMDNAFTRILDNYIRGFSRGYSLNRTSLMILELAYKHSQYIDFEDIPLKKLPKKPTDDISRYETIQKCGRTFYYFKLNQYSQ